MAAGIVAGASSIDLPLTERARSRNNPNADVGPILRNPGGIMRRFALILLIVFFATASFAVADFAAEKAKGDALWPSRDNQAKLTKALVAYEAALAENPDDEALLVRLGTAHYWHGNNMAKGDSEARKAAYQKGMDHSQHACDLNPKSVGGNFWFAVNQASFGRERGLIKSTSYLPEIKRRMKIVEQLDKFYYYGGPQRFMARIITKSPGFLRSKFGGPIEDAEKSLKEAIAKYPDFTLTHLYLAEVYMEMKKPEAAKVEIQRVLDTPENAMPEFAAENRRDKKKAKALMSKHFGG
jgi:tetratricopeptide (TPR) repeat protein